MNYRLLFSVWLVLLVTACGSTPTIAPTAPTLPSTATPSAPTPTIAPSPTPIRTAPSATPSATLAPTHAAPSATPVPAIPTPIPATPTSQTNTRQWHFDTDTIGGLPIGMVSFSGTWVVRAEAAAPSAPNALCQTGNATYPALSLGSTTYTDVSVTTRFKPISGQIDQAAGIIFRVKDKDNFYILRANALEDNVNLYTYINGQRNTIKEGNVKVPSGQWQELRAEVVGNRLRGFLNGQLVVETTHNQFTAGGVGLWTKADSVTCFDEVTVRTP